MRFFICAIISFLLFSCNEGSKNYTTKFLDPVIYNKTVKKLNDIVLENNFPPMIASRNYAYANIAAYECIVAGDSLMKSLYLLIIDYILKIINRIYF